MKTLLSLLLTAMLAGYALGQFTTEPPYPEKALKTTFLVNMDSATTGCSGNQCDVSVTISAPAFGTDGTPPEDKDRPGPFPVIFFINGFQMVTTSYEAYANALVSWGYAVVQYQVPTRLIPIGALNDRDELTFLDPLLDAVKEKNEDENEVVFGLLDLDRIAMAGHSRGAKLAVLHYLGDDRVQAAFMIDPVDNSRFAQPSPEFPDAVKVLDEADDTKKVGIVGASIVGTCNPTGENFAAFWDVSKTGSWLSVVEGVGHLTFVDIPNLQRLLCGIGRKNFDETSALVIPSLVHWFDRVFYPPNGLEIDREFTRWGQEKISTGDFTEFSVKP